MIKLQLHPDARMLRQFAWASLLMFPLVAFGILRLPSPWNYATAGVGVVVFATELAGIHAVSRFVFRLLVTVSFPIGLVLFPLLVGMVYYGVFTPVGLVFRLMGRDAMKRRFDPALTSYWQARPNQRPSSSYFKLY